jgi:5'-nucleotidase
MKEKVTILITNDDGIHTSGLNKLVEIARDYGKVVVVAPDQPRSGQSHAVSVAVPLHLTQLKSEKDFEEYICSGTPVDAIKLGEQIILKKNPDLILSGINHGSNASVNVIYSGTMAAAREAAIDGIPGIGFSLLDYSPDANFGEAEQYIRQIIENVIRHGLPPLVALNVNIPAVPNAKLQGIRVCHQSKGRWKEMMEERKDEKGNIYYWLTGTFEDMEEKDEGDIKQLDNNFVTITPVHVDSTAYDHINELSERFNV